MPREGRVVAGVITGSHGIKGEARMASFLVGNLDLAEVSEVTITTPDGNARQWKLIRARPGKRNWIILLEGVNSPKEAEELKGATVEVHSSLLPPAGEGEYYWRDLIGLEVRTVDGRSLGKVKGLIPRGEQDVLEVDDGQKEALIPMAGPFIESIDIEKGLIIVNPPEGLVD